MKKKYLKMIIEQLEAQLAGKAKPKQPPRIPNKDKPKTKTGSAHARCLMTGGACDRLGIPKHKLKNRLDRLPPPHRHGSGKRAYWFYDDIIAAKKSGVMNK